MNPVGNNYSVIQKTCHILIFKKSIQLKLPVSNGMKEYLSKNIEGFIPRAAKLCGELFFNRKKSYMWFSPKIKKLCGGFTLLELMVSLGIFSILMLLAVGGFIRSLRTERQTSSFTFVNSSLSEVIEQMTREIRTGKDFCANGASCQSSSILSFVNAKGNNVTYCLDDGGIKKDMGINCSLGQKITGEKVLVNYLNFIISNNQRSGDYPPRITILVGANPKNQEASFYKVNLETTVSSRRLTN